MNGTKLFLGFVAHFMIMPIIRPAAYNAMVSADTAFSENETVNFPAGREGFDDDKLKLLDDQCCEKYAFENHSVKLEDAMSPYDDDDLRKMNVNSPFLKDKGEFVFWGN